MRKLHLNTKLYHSVFTFNKKFIPPKFALTLENFNLLNILIAVSCDIWLIPDKWVGSIMALYPWKSLYSWKITTHQIVLYFVVSNIFRASQRFQWKSGRARLTFKVIMGSLLSSSSSRLSNRSNMETRLSSSRESRQNSQIWRRPNNIWPTGRT